MRVAIIGAGLQGGRRAQALQEFSDVEPAVVTASRLSQAQQLARRMNCAAGVGWKEFVQRPDIDAVVVCTPPDLHAPITLEAIRHGKHVLCEKPLARTVQEAEAMVQAAREHGVVLKCGFNHRHHPAIQQAKEHFDRGLFGRPLFLRSVYGICGRPDYEREWRANPRVVSGGQLMEQGIHVVDLFRWFLGELAEVTGFIETCYWPIQPLEDNAFVIFRSREGVPASVHSSLTQWKNRFCFELYGDKGYAVVEGLGGGYGVERLVLGKKTFNRPFQDEMTEFRGPDVSWREEWKEFVAAIRENREPLGSAQDGLEALRLVFAAYQAGRGSAVVPTAFAAESGVGAA